MTQVRVVKAKQVKQGPILALSYLAAALPAMILHEERFCSNGQSNYIEKTVIGCS